MTSGPADPGRRSQLDELIHSPTRLAIMATLHHVGELDFASLRDTVEVSDSQLSKQVRQLEDAGYLMVTKGYVGRRPRTWLSLTPQGRDAFARYRVALDALLGPGVAS